MKRNIISYSKEYGFMVIIAFLMICSNSIIAPGLESLVVSFMYIGYCKISKGYFDMTYARPYVFFLIACFLSVLAYFQIDYHIFVFTALILICTPFIISREVFLFERKFIKTVLLTFPLVSLICFYCYVNGINAFNPYATFGEELDTSFSAIYPHPMWLAPVTGLANMVLLWLTFSLKKGIYKCVAIVIMILSVYVTVVAGSRTAFFATVICMTVGVLYKMRSFKKFLLYSVFIGTLLSVTAPIYYSHSTQMQNKFEGGKDYKYGSRTMLFTEGFRHYKDSPIIGSGFATAWYANDNLVLGRLESGSGWLSILFQLGLVGVISMMVILLKVKRVVKYLKYDNTLHLFVLCLLFICFHSCFEGYLLTVGYYIGLIFWLLIGHLSIYPEMKRKYNLNFE